jgi:hypothetical protein
MNWMFRMLILAKSLARPSRNRAERFADHQAALTGPRKGLPELCATVRWSEPDNPAATTTVELRQDDT